MNVSDLPKSLFELSSATVAQLTYDGYWNGKLKPFVGLSSNAIDKVYDQIQRIWFSNDLNTKNLEPLISSGNMTRLNLILLLEQLRGKTVEDLTLEIRNIFQHLSLECKHLTRLVVFLEFDGECRFKEKAITPVLNDVLKNSPNLKYLASNIKFDLGVLSNCPRLEVLIIYFLLSVPIYEFLKYNDQFRPHKSLKKYFIRRKTKPDDQDIAIVLQYCSELRYINIDISKALELRHTPEFLFGIYSCQYKIEKLYLHLAWDLTNQDLLSPNSFKIVTETCPNVKMLCVVTDNIGAIPPLRIFRNVRVLSIEMSDMIDTDFNRGLFSLLGPLGIGHNLSGLVLKGFTNVDFSTLALWCPNIQTLSVIYKTDKTGELSSTAFKNLRVLSIENLSDLDSNESLFKVLYSAPNLESLTVYNLFSDDMLEDILRKNKLSKLKRLHILRCELTRRGAELIMENFESLINLRINHSPHEDEIEDAFYEANLNINRTSEVYPRYWEFDYGNIESADVEFSNPENRFIDEVCLYHDTYFMR